MPTFAMFPNREVGRPSTAARSSDSRSTRMKASVDVKRGRCRKWSRPSQAEILRQGDQDRHDDRAGDGVARETACAAPPTTRTMTKRLQQAGHERQAAQHHLRQPARRPPSSNTITPSDSPADDQDDAAPSPCRAAPSFQTSTRSPGRKQQQAATEAPPPASADRSPRRSSWRGGAWSARRRSSRRTPSASRSPRGVGGPRAPRFRFGDLAPRSMGNRSISGGKRAQAAGASRPGIISTAAGHAEGHPAGEGDVDAGQLPQVADGGQVWPPRRAGGADCRRSTARRRTRS